MSGGEGTLRWRSDPPASTRDLRAAWTSNMLKRLGKEARWLKFARRPLDERRQVPPDDLGAGEDAHDAAEREERTEGDLDLARLAHAALRGDHAAGHAA